MSSKADQAVALLVDSQRALHEELRQVRLQLAQQSRLLQALLQRRPNPANSDAGSERALRALSAMPARLKPLQGVAEESAQAEEQASEAAKGEWIRDGRLISSKEMGQAWHRTRQALEQACERGELFSLKIVNRRWYPAMFAELGADDVKAVCTLLQPLDPVSCFIFWVRKHASLGGKTMAEALKDGQLAAVLRAAESFASEQGGLSH